jgi:hypothetical protein
MINQLPKPDDGKGPTLGTLDAYSNHPQRLISRQLSRFYFHFPALSAREGALCTFFYYIYLMMVFY